MGEICQYFCEKNTLSIFSISLRFIAQFPLFSAHSPILSKRNHARFFSAAPHRSWPIITRGTGGTPSANKLSIGMLAESDGGRQIRLAERFFLWVPARRTPLCRPAEFAGVWGKERKTKKPRAGGNGADSDPNSRKKSRERRRITRKTCV